ncbi:dihydroorotate dehydrogenase [candidate division BRC1 bacterium HGW-BRC1-1]|jgi:dihydroorotate dehydrogenase (fumarate)|nr:MAG: dihydroorotate dehydrogenase [candidate division BRC1 bacterium HGW-BRC1-1]
MDMKTKYLGLDLAHPLIPGASPLVDDIDMVRRLEDAGAPAIVMHSIFEEQITMEGNSTIRAYEETTGLNPESENYFPKPGEFRLGPDQYLEQIRRIKEMTSVPVIGSLNGVTDSGWIDYAKLIQQAGADALELNVYYLSTNVSETALQVEKRAIDITRKVKATVDIPVSVKLSVFYSSLPNLAVELDAAGADGLVLFNRFYQPDIDIEAMEVVPSLQLSDSSELLMRLRWAAILAGRIKANIAVSGGVHTPTDAIKSVMCGADVVQVVSALLRNGPEYLTRLRDGMQAWMEEHEYESVAQMRGSMSLFRSPNPAAFERANYQKILQNWRP